MDVGSFKQWNMPFSNPKDHVSSFPLATWSWKHRPTTRTKSGTVIFHFVATSAEAG